MAIKSYLHFEGERNRKNATLFEKMIKHAYGEKNAVICGHHLTFEFDGDLTTENEIPAADTLIFDHEIMEANFGDDAYMVMQACAAVRAEYRDELLQQHYDMYGPEAYHAPAVDTPVNQHADNSIPHIPAELG